MWRRVFNHTSVCEGKKNEQTSWFACMYVFIFYFTIFYLQTSTNIRITRKDGDVKRKKTKNDLPNKKLDLKNDQKGKYIFFIQQLLSCGLCFFLSTLIYKYYPLNEKKIIRFLQTIIQKNH